jgi:hypothetical protein
MYKRRKRKKKAIQSDYALSVTKGQSLVIQTYIKAGIREEMIKPKKRILKYSRCGE